MGHRGLFVLDGGSRKSKERSQLMIRGITTGFFPCAGQKARLALTLPGKQVYTPSLWAGEGHRVHTSTAATSGAKQPHAEPGQAQSPGDFRLMWATEATKTNTKMLKLQKFRGGRRMLQKWGLHCLHVLFENRWR